MPPALPKGKGFVVAGADTASFLKAKLTALGLTPAEYNEFIVYWLPRMNKNKFNQVYFAGRDYTDYARLEISPKADSVLRVFMLFQAIESCEPMEPQKLTVPKRSGFTVVEWGGAEVTKNRQNPAE